MPNIPVLIKPVRDLCNLNCSYCFYKDRATAPKIEEKRISIEIAGRLQQINDSTDLYYIFQGGEPTLLGIEYFSAVLLALWGTGQTLKNKISIQTNGLLLSEDWINTLKSLNPLYGISIDGPSNTKRGINTEELEKTINILKRYNANYNILCTVSKENVYSPRETIKYLSKLGKHIQFIPAQPLTPGCFTESPTGEEYRDFLRGVLETFDELYDPPIIENFEAAKMAWNNVHTTCESTERCGTYLVIEANGDIYPCDFYVEDKWKLGNVFEIDKLSDVFSNPAYNNKMESFRDQKQIPTEECSTCLLKPACNNGCPRHRYLAAGNQEDLSIYCEAHKFISEVGFLSRNLVKPHITEKD